MDASGGVKKIELSTEQTENGSEIRFKQIAGLSDVPTENFPSERERSLLGLLGADLTADPGSGEIVLKLSENKEQ